MPRSAAASWMRAKRRARSFLHRYVIAYLPRRYEQSKNPVVVVVPLAVKDLGIAASCLRSIRENLRHRIERIVVVGQTSAEIARFCESNGVEYVDEATVLRADLEQTIVDLGLQARRGWIKQQFLKLNVADYLEGENFLICDADTILVRPLAFMDGERQILWTADDLVPEYHIFTESLIGPVRRRNYSFVSHCMLFQRRILEDLDARVRTRCGTSVFEAMLKALAKSRNGYMSEYELYAYFLVKYHSEAYIARYWYNRKATLACEESLSRSLRKFRRFNFLSDHNKPIRNEPRLP